MLKIPEEFKMICINFQPYAMDDFDTDEKFIKFTISELNPAQREIAFEFIDKIVNSSLGEEELESILRESGSYLRIIPGEGKWARNFLKRIQQALV